MSVVRETSIAKSVAVHLTAPVGKWVPGTPLRRHDQVRDDYVFSEVGETRDDAAQDRIVIDSTDWADKDNSYDSIRTSTHFVQLMSSKSLAFQWSAKSLKSHIRHASTRNRLPRRSAQGRQFNNGGRDMCGARRDPPPGAAHTCAKPAGQRIARYLHRT